MVHNIYKKSTMAKYSVSNLQFPDDLGSQPDLQHWVSFYINVRGKSRFNQDNRVRVVNENAGAALDNNQLTTAAKNIADLATVFLTVGAAERGSQGDFAGAVFSAGGAGFAQKVASDIRNGEGVFKTDSTQQLSSVINLHMQEAPSVKYGANYNDADLGILTGMLSMINSVKDLSDVVMNPSVAQDAKAAAVISMMQIPSVIAGGATRFENIVSSAFKIKTNPFREVLFESVDYRTFNFRYRFMPKSQQESDNIRRIINTFKFHMHPELTENKFFYIYPSEFEIVYNYRGGANKYFNKIQNCALIDLAVEYGGDKFATFDNGAPVETILTLSFRELELLHKGALADPEKGGVYGY